MTQSWVAQASEPNKDKWDVNNPPGEQAFVDIKTDTGTWMNLDVSPDGRLIVFDMLGDIYTMPISGGEAKNITNSMAWDMQAKFSPDGSRLVFTTDQGGGDNIWTMAVDGTDQQAVTDEKFRLLNAPSWSPDGNYIVARKHFTGMRSLGAGEIWMYHKSGGKGVQLNKRPNEQKDLGEPVYTPDGNYVLFSRDSTPGRIFEYSKDSNTQIYEIFAIELATGEIESWVSGPGGAVRPTPSPDGDSLAFVRRIRNDTALFIQDRESGAVRPIFTGLERDMQETWAIHGVYPSMAWMPDGKGIVFYAKGKIHHIDVASKTVKNIPFQVDDRREIRQAVTVKNEVSPTTFEAKMLRWLQLSPDGDLAVFQSMGHLYTVGLKNGAMQGQPKRLTKQAEHFEFFPQFSADGKQIVYTTWHDEELGTVRVSNLRGKSKVVSSRPGHYTNPAISKDGKHVVFEATSGGYLTSPLYSHDTGLFVVNVANKTQNKIADSGANPFFTNDSQRIFFVGQSRSGEVVTTQLKSVDLSGNEEQHHYQGEWITQYKVSPDEQWLAFVQNYQVYVTPFVRNGKHISTGSGATNLPVENFSEHAGDYIHWNQSSNQLSWAMGATLYQQKLSDRFDFLGGEIKVGDKDQAGESKPSAKSSQITFNVETDIPKGTVALVGAKIITMEQVDGEQLVIEDGVIIVNNNRITAVGSAASITPPENAEVIDLKGKAIIPGLVDVHWHGPYANGQITPQNNWNAQATLAFGVTTTHNPSANTAAVFSSSEMQKANKILAPRIYSTGTILYGANHYFTAKVDSLDDAIGHLERMKAAGAFSVKSYNQPRRDQRQQVLEAARQTGLMVVPEGGSLFMHNMTMVIDGHTGIEHSIPVGAIYDDVKQLWSGTQTAYVPTLTVGYGGIWGERYWYDTTEVWKHPLLTQYVPDHVLQPGNVRRMKAPLEDYGHFNNARVATELQNEGVDVLLGAHGQREGLGSHWEMWMFAQGGMSPWNVIKASTIDGAKYIGMDHELGSIKVGKLADLVILDADPMQDIRNSDQVSHVMLNGRLYEAATMNQIYPEKQTRPKFYFE
ncbi:amidohydrolase family protein [Marinicella sp. S1101]|uniref:amidohydrolase family protein n=1 Tax=Marinicella marina TaxID=2996016 RepID=UPI002260ABB2|nr:amidohydrolase family protein [Marinicella marina]MCX7553731.1 amidohydrolase family protein [Marinicella marina]MDJ1140806.1 amidohydrolase family protein [Marinicella marina]